MVPKDQVRIHQFGNQVLPGIFLGDELIAEGIWKGDILKADLEDLETLDASHTYIYIYIYKYPRRISRKEVLIRQKDDEFIFPIAAILARNGSTFSLEMQMRSPPAVMVDLVGEITAWAGKMDAWRRVMWLRYRAELHVKKASVSKPAHSH